MANLMNVPILGIVENMSYVKCPDCGRELHVFGESKVKALAAKTGIELLAQIPIDERLSALCDKGIIELMENDYLDSACDRIIEKLG